MFDYLVIGAGLTGITLCKKLREKGYENLLVLEKEEKPGGLCRSVNIGGHILDIGGGHFFHTKHQEIFDYVFKYLPKEQFNYYNRVSKLEIGDSTIDYPIESNVWQLPIEEQIDYIISIIRNGESAGSVEPCNYEDWIRWKLGDKICEEYMLPYNMKLWGVEPKQMDIDWLYKIPRVDVKEVLQYALEKQQDKNKFPAHIHFYYPKKGGFQSIVNAIVKDEMAYIRCGEAVTKLEYKHDHWVVNDKYAAKNLINTTPWNDLYSALEPPVELKKYFDKIQYNKIVISLYEKDYDVDWHWRYIPDRKKDYHREFYIHNFAEDSKHNGIYLETNVKNFDEKKKQLDGLWAIANYVTDAAYPIPVIGHAEAINKIRTYYEPFHLYGVGRWGQHEYQNADVSMKAAFDFVDAIGSSK